jgi:phage baseplate assembly protein gpV
VTAVQRALVAILVSVMVAGTSLGGLAGLATAEPRPAEPVPTEPVFADPRPDTTPPIAWTQLGLSDRVDMVGADLLVDTDIPVPPGVIPGQLLGTIGSVVNAVDARVDVIDGRGVALGSIPAPTGLGSAPFAIDISQARVVNGIAKVSFVLRDRNPPGNSCSRSSSLTLSQLGATYLGQTPYPVIVADFLPGYLDQILIRTGPAPTPAQQQAALELVAKLTRLYRPMPVRIDVDSSVGAAPPGPPSRRVIELRDNSPAGLQVIDPNSPDAALVISGRGPELGNQVALFSDRRVKLAQTDSATVTAAQQDTPTATTIKTFAQLGMGGRISVQGTGTLYVGFDASRFAVGSIQQATLHLIGHYSPVIAGEASVVVRAGDAVLAARRLDESGLLDITGTIPKEAINSAVGVVLELRYLPKQECGPLNDRLEFALDPSSTVAVTPGTHNRGGFPVLPMAFTPDFAVVVDRPEHLRFAAAALNLLAQQTGVTLQPRLTDMASAAGSGQGLLVVGPGDDLKKSGLIAPVTFEGGNTVDIGGATETVLDLNGPIGVVQAFSHNDRMVLAVNGTGDWALVQRSFDYIRALDSRWASLSGDVVATGAAGQTVPLTLREGGALPNEYPGDSWRRWTLLSAGTAAAILLATAGVLLWRRLGRRG